MSYNRIQEVRISRTQREAGIEYLPWENESGIKFLLGAAGYLAFVTSILFLLSFAL